MVQHITALRGTERATLNLAGILLDRGHEVTILSTFTRPLDAAPALDSRLRVVHLGVGNDARGSNVRRAVKFLVTALRYARHLRPGTTVIGTESALTAALALACLGRPGVRLLGWEHMTYEMAPPLAQQLRRVFYRRLHGLVVLNGSDRRHFEADGLRGVQVIPNASPPPRVTGHQPVQARQRLLAVGAHVPDKGFARLIRMAAPVLTRFPGWRLAIVGQDVPGSDLAEVAAEAGVAAQVDLLPPRQDIEAEYAQAAAVLVASAFESFSMVIVEAKGHGVPAVAFDCPHGPRELLRDGVDGFLVPYGDEATFQDRVAHLVADATLHARLSQEAAASAEAYTPQAVYTRWQPLLG